MFERIRRNTAAYDSTRAWVASGLYTAVASITEKLCALVEAVAGGEWRCGWQVNFERRSNYERRMKNRA